MHMDKLICIIVLLVSLGVLSSYVIPEVTERVTPITNENLTINKINIHTDINNISIDNGVYQLPGTNMLFGHRTTHGSIFFNLDKLVVGDEIIFNGVTYHVISTTVVSEDTNLKDNGNLFLITCTPIGSTSHRIVVEASNDMSKG